MASMPIEIPQTSQIPINQLVARRDLWPRFDADEERVEMFADQLRAGDDLAPIEVVPHNDGKYLIADGVHRTHAAVRAGRNDVPYRRGSPTESQDMRALEEGVQTPPHVAYQLKAIKLRDPRSTCLDLANLAEEVAEHLERILKAAQVGGSAPRIFIGHGRSTAWRALRHFLVNTLRLDYEEFNRVSPAGIATAARIQTMLEGTSVAFLVLTAEDEYNDGTLHARENVIHEAGLFQGRLGFERALVVLEEGCQKFSNIQGLGQIRFPQGNIEACFEEVRRVLLRESLI